MRVATRFGPLANVQKSRGDLMKKLLVAVSLLGSVQTAIALETWKDATVHVNRTGVWNMNTTISLSFQNVFPKPIYKKSYFGLVILSSAIISASAFSYLTAGAGAPVAAAGVSSVASWAAGGGAGSYMAGLSTIGGWFGGNAMLGSAILNGISIGVTGGGAAFATLPAVAKVGVMASVTASALDGVFAFQKPETKNIYYKVRLTLPKNLGGKEVQRLTQEIYKVEEQILQSDPDKDKKTYLALEDKKKALDTEGVAQGSFALKVGGTTEDLMMLAIISKNAGRSDLFEKLLNMISTRNIEDTGYIDYLKAVAKLERGDTKTATTLLRKSWRLNPYAIEQPLLLINILGREKFETQEKEIRAIVEKATNDFDSDKYDPGYSLVSLNYRLATMYLLKKKYALAQSNYEKAYDELSLVQKYVGNKSIKNIIRLGIANAMYGQNNKSEARKLLEKILSDAKSDTERSLIRAQYAGNI
jgi:tetratricopeptide (TPR) repeat protein